MSSGISGVEGNNCAFNVRLPQTLMISFISDCYPVRMQSVFLESMRKSRQQLREMMPGTKDMSVGIVFLGAYAITEPTSGFPMDGRN